MRSSIRTVSWPLLALLFASPSRPAHAAPDPVAPLQTPTPAPRPIEMREMVWASRHGGVRHKPFPFRDNLILDDPALFRLLGRDDLLRLQEEHVRTRAVLGVGGLLALLGSAFALKEAGPQLECSGQTGCQTQRSDNALAAGVALLVLSASLVVASLAVNPSAITDDERLRLIEQYNRSITPQPTTTSP